MMRKSNAIPNIELAGQKRSYKKNDFLPILSYIFSTARFFGISSYGWSVAFCWFIVLFLMLLTLEIIAIWKVIRLLSGSATNSSGGDGIVGRLSGSIFYGNALLSLLLSTRFISSWKDISFLWLNADTTIKFIQPCDVNIKKRTIFVTIFLASCAFVEHILSMVSATGLDCPPEDFFQRYILSSHGFLLQPHEYNLLLAIPIFILSKLATILWNFQDLIIILVSMGLTSRYHRLNLHVHRVIKLQKRSRDVNKIGTDMYIHGQVWRRIREAYVRQAAMVRMSDRKLGPLVLLSNINNLYFICLQLYLGIKTDKGTTINRVYYFISLGWLVFRACSVVLAAADVHVHSTRALSYLYSCPGYAFNVEIKRLKHQLTNDFVALTGMGYFSLTRYSLLQVAAAVLKYELVLIQYD